MSKVKFFNEPKAYKEEISRYFPDTIPVTFSNLKEQFNITIFGMDIALLKNIDTLRDLHNLDDIAGIALIDENNINLIYNNNNSINVKEQRFALANLIGYCENLKGKNEKPSVCKRFSSIQKCDDIQDNISQEDFQEYVNNNYARQILMPKEWFEKHYVHLSKTLSFEDTIKALSELYIVPKKQVKIRCKELGYIVSIESPCKKNKKIRLHRLKPFFYAIFILLNFYFFQNSIFIIISTCSLREKSQFCTMSYIFFILGTFIKTGCK